MASYCDFCADVLTTDDLMVPAEPHFHGAMHAECHPLWAEQYYGGDEQAPWERHWRRYLDASSAPLTARPRWRIIAPAGSDRGGQG